MKEVGEVLKKQKSPQMTADSHPCMTFQEKTPSEQFGQNIVFNVWNGKKKWELLIGKPEKSQDFYSIAYSSIQQNNTSNLFLKIV